VEGVARRVEHLERHPLTLELEVSEDEREQEGDRTEVRDVVLRQLVALLELGTERLHLRDTLPETTLDEAGHPKDE